MWIPRKDPRRIGLAKFLEAVEIEDRIKSGRTGKRYYDPEKERLAIQLDKARWQRWIETGKLEVLGPRRWRLNLKAPGSE
jgi:hypothetical protein